MDNKNLNRLSIVLRVSWWQPIFYFKFIIYKREKKKSPKNYTESALAQKKFSVSACNWLLLTSLLRLLDYKKTSKPPDGLWVTEFPCHTWATPKLNLFFCFCQHLRRGVGISLKAFTVEVVQAPDSLIINVTLVTSVEIIGKQIPPTLKFRVVSWHHLFPVITTNRHFSCEISQTVWHETSHKQEHFVTLISSWNWSPWERSTKSNRPQLFLTMTQFSRLDWEK